MNIEQKFPFFRVFLVLCVPQLGSCFTAQSKPHWNAIHDAKSPQCHSIDMPEDGLGIDGLNVVNGRFALTTRDRSGNKRVYLSLFATWLEEIDGAEYVQHTGNSSLAVAAIMHDSGDAVAVVKSESDRSQVIGLGVNGSQYVIGEISSNHFDILAAVATKSLVAFLIVEYAEVEMRTYLLKFSPAGSADGRWIAHYSPIQSKAIRPIHFADRSAIGWVGETDNGVLVLEVFPVGDGPRNPVILPGTSIDRSTETHFAGSRHSDGWTLLAISPAASDTNRASILDFSRNAEGVLTLAVRSQFTDLENLGVAQPAIYTDDRKSVVVMGNWLDAERTVGTYTLKRDSTSIAPLARYIGHFPPDSVIENFELHRGQRLSWTVKTRASYGWNFQRCFYSLE
jgi:hypothetical protein